MNAAPDGKGEVRMNAAPDGNGLKLNSHGPATNYETNELTL